MDGQVHPQAAAGVTALPPPPGPQTVALPPPITTGGGGAVPSQARTLQAARPPMPHPPVGLAQTKRPGRKGGRGGRGVAAGAAEQDDPLIRLGPEISRNSERLRTGWRPVQLSSEDKAAEVALSDEQLTASSSAGYRMVRATHGAYCGTWYFEVKVNRLGPSGAARVGWATRRAEIDAPVGSDKYGFSYRSMQGSKVHAGWRDDYGEEYKEGDVVGCLLHMPEGGRPFEQGPADVVKYKNKLYFIAGEQAEPVNLAGSFVAFTLNGKLQGKAYTDIPEGTYYPAISLYTNPTKQHAPASVTVNFGERGFASDPPEIEGCPTAQPAFYLSGPRPGQAQASQPQAGERHQSPAPLQQVSPPQQQLGPREPTELGQEQQSGPPQQQQQQQQPGSPRLHQPEQHTVQPMQTDL